MVGLRYAEDSAEVEVLDAHKKRLEEISKRIKASLGRIRENGDSLKAAVGPAYSDTQHLQVVNRNVDNLLAALDRTRAPLEGKADEERVLRDGPNAVGLQNYLASMRRIEAKHNELTRNHMRVNQDAARELGELLSHAAQQLSDLFAQLLQEGPEKVEPLQYITKSKPFPVPSDTTLAQLAELHTAVVNSPGGGGERDRHGVPRTVAAYGDIRGKYLQATLANLASASLTTSRRPNADTIYQRGTCAIGTYAQGLEGLFAAEWASITVVFQANDWGKAFELATARALADFARTLREINSQVKANITTDCFLAYEVVGIVAELAFELDKRTGFLKQPLLDAVKPLRDTAKVSLAELLDDVRRRVGGIPFLPQDGSGLPYTSEVMTRLQALPAYATPLGNIMASLGAGNWSLPASATNSSSSLPTLKSFDVNPDTAALLGRYVLDTLETLFQALDAKARVALKHRPLVGVFLVNNAAVADRRVRASELAPLLAQQPPAAASKLNEWRKRGTALYLESWREPCAQLMEVQYTNRTGGGSGSGGGQRPPSGSQGQDSVAIVKALGGKEKDAIKEKFKVFNVLFESLSQRHRELAPHMEREVRQQLARDVQQLIEPLYGRFWERYHEIDKGKHKYVRYDKATLAGQLASLG